MKLRRVIAPLLFAVITAGFACLPVFADDVTDRISAETGAEHLWTELPEEVTELLEEMGIDTVDYTQLSELDVTEFISALLPSLKRSVGYPLKEGCVLLGAVLICLLCSTLTDSSPSLKKVSVAVCGLLLLSPLADTLSRLSAVISTASGFMKAYVPVCAGLAAASGAPASASVYSAFQLGLCSVTETAAESVIVPVTGMLTALCAVTSIEETPASAVNEFLLKAVKWGLGVLSVAAGGILSLQTSLAAASDSITVRGAKFALSGLIPVVGGTLSEALNTVISASSVIRSSVGVIGIASVIILLLPSLIELMMWQTVCRLLSFFSGCCDSRQLEKFFSRFANTVSILIAVTAVTGALLIFATAILLKTGG